MKEIEGINKVLLGVDRETRESIYISKPTWDCDWYWGFGYIGNRSLYYHLKSYEYMWDSLPEQFELNPNIENNLWMFCELVRTAYALREAAELFGRGGAHVAANNPCKDLIKDNAQTAHINDVALPAVLNELQALIEGRLHYKGE